MAPSIAGRSSGRHIGFGGIRSATAAAKEAIAAIAERAREVGGSSEGQRESRGEEDLGLKGRARASIPWRAQGD